MMKLKTRDGEKPPANPIFDDGANIDPIYCSDNINEEHTTNVTKAPQTTSFSESHPAVPSNLNMILPHVSNEATSFPESHSTGPSNLNGILPHQIQATCLSKSHPAGPSNLNVIVPHESKDQIQATSFSESHPAGPSNLNIILPHGSKDQIIPQDITSFYEQFKSWIQNA